MTKKRIRVEDISKASEKLSELRKEDFKPLPAPFDKPENTPDFAPLSDKAKERYDTAVEEWLARGRRPFAAKRKEKGYTLEILLPWTNLDISPGPGREWPSGWLKNAVCIRRGRQPYGNNRRAGQCDLPQLR